MLQGSLLEQLLQQHNCLAAQVTCCPCPVSFSPSPATSNVSAVCLLMAFLEWQALTWVLLAVQEWA